ncbi:MAG: hypothetical protein CBD16_00040 [Betaproteobacteria bacterium TMED156]|nr:MAG: hypothetical protein CBD16_00040 [Betaproteobacteria bacterium TMED156]|tara:strand:- start:529 stop:951 length:423 start_codon:yes stop_codon:yes gene_type:complete
MTDTPVSLASLMTPSKTVSVDYPGYTGFSIDLCYLAREELIKVRKKCLSNKWNKRTHQPEEELDDEKFLTEYAKAVIKGWKGLKYRYLEELLLVDISDLDPDDELVYTQENAELLMKNATSFDTWVTDNVGDLENFTGDK